MEGTFCSARNSRTFETKANGMESSLECRVVSRFLSSRIHPKSRRLFPFYFSNITPLTTDLLTFRVASTVFVIDGEMCRLLAYFDNPGNMSGISEMRTIQLKILEILGGQSNGTEIPSHKFSKIWVYLARLSSFLEILERADPFVSGNFRKRKLEFWVKRKAPSYDSFLGKFLKILKIREIWVYLARLSSFTEIPENAVPFHS